uniref:CDC45-like protein n=1 Tax=Setaria italica TaxID=4555 RepID=K4AL66_SETIT
MVRELRVDAFYARLRAAAAAAGSSSPLLILPSAADADSLCAVRALLSADSVRFSVFPVASAAAAARTLLASFSASAPLCLVVVNWGAHRDLRAVLPETATAFVVDSHRLVHLHNLCARNGRVVVLFTADDERAADLPYDFDLTALADDPLRAASGSDSDSEDSDADEDVRGGGRRKSAGSPTTSTPTASAFHGKPSGRLIYVRSRPRAAPQHQRAPPARLRVALTDQFVHDSITSERYQAAVMELEQHVNGSGNLDPSGAGAVVTLKDGTKVRAPEASRIAYEDELRLMLLREWGLFDSMLCSSYVATKLKTWTDNGLKKLKLLLARMGFPLADCKKSFQYMSMEVKRKMRDEFERLLPEYGLTEFDYRSFLRVHGYRSKVSAADVVYGVTALLESLNAESNGSKESSAAKQFWAAYSALSLSNVDQLQKGMQSAIEIQRAILRQRSSAITKTGVCTECQEVPVGQA